MNNLKLFLICMIIFKTLPIPAQTAFCENVPEIGEFMKVTAKSGINLRSTPNIKGEIIDKIPVGDLVYVLTNASEVTVEGIEGYWFSVFYGGKQGFVFNGYLEPIDLGDSIEFYLPEFKHWDEPANIVYDQYPTTNWSGIFYEENENNTQYVAKKIPFIQISEDGGGYQYKVAENFDFKPVLLFTNLVFKKKQVQFKKYGNIIYPGETVFFELNNETAPYNSKIYQVFATGEPYATGNQISETNAFTGIKNYQLWVRLIQRNSTNPSEWVVATKQLLYSNDVLFSPELRNCPPSLYALGDFDEDGKLDAIFGKTDGKGARFYLCLSSKAVKNYMMRFCATFTFSC
jgi:hypothetical protein